MKEDLVSVIVPVYNMEKYLEKCLKSIIDQTYKKIEIIIVNDGSTDSSIEICNKFKENDNRIKIITKKNAGLGMARNTGLENANGEYVYFIDSDDYIEETLIEDNIKLMKEYKLDISTFGAILFEKNEKIIKEIRPIFEKQIFEGKEIKNIFFPSFLGLSNKYLKNLVCSAWSCVYRKEFLDSVEWQFESERKIISEDFYALLKLIGKANKIGVISKSYYYYRQNLGSLTHKYKEDRLDKLNYWLEECLKICNEEKYNKEIVSAVYKYYFSNIIGALKTIYYSNLDDIKKITELKKYIYNAKLQESLLHYNYKNDSLKRRIIIKLIKYKKYKILNRILIKNIK